MIRPKCYRLRTVYDGSKKGETVYDFMLCDYGMASEDSRHFGEDYVSVTRDPNGVSPSFTVPKSILEPVEPPEG